MNGISSRAWYPMSILLAGAILGCDAASPTKKAEEHPAPAKDVVLEGTIGMLADAIHEQTKLDLDADPWKGIVAIRTADGELVPILPTSAGRFFYADPALLGRQIRIQGRRHQGVPGVEVIDRHTIVNGRPNEAYYWCEICSIKMHHLQQCECCQGPVEFREHPVGETFKLGSKSPDE